MSLPPIPDNAPEALRLVCLYLAQTGPTHSDLGYISAAAAFIEIGDIFKVPPATVKNERDAFDRFTDSDRVGWNKVALPRRLKIVHDTYGNIPKDELRRMAARILELEWIEPMTTSLPNLAVIISDCRQKIAQIDESQSVSLDPANVDRLLNSYRELNPSHSISFVGGHTFYIQTGDQARCISIQELPKLAIVAEHLRALQLYREALDAISLQMGFESRTSGKGSDFFRFLPNKTWKNDAGQTDADAFVSATLAVLPDPADQAAMDRFVSDPEWSGIEDGRKLNRSSDWQESAILRTGGMVAAASAGRINLIRAIEHAGFGANLVKISGQSGACSGGENVIYYGAPGTGKSHAVEELVGNKRSFRTVFHSDMQNSDFIGTLKPAVEGGNVTYRFQPGTFSKALRHAWNTPDEEVYLIIEEINRAMAAAVFGELFQLLDRDETGTSRYKVEFPSPEYFQWFNELGGIQCDALTLPPNLWILATMNSADQGVYPIDTAFRRRWKQIYVPIDYEIAPRLPLDIIGQSSQPSERTWNEFVQVLNEFLIDNLGIAEDRLVGPRFLNLSDLSDKKLPGKLLIYLWDDLLRHHERDVLFVGGIRTYGELHKANENSERIFSDKMLAVLGIANVQPEGQTD
jgi:hypothetical protein